MEEVMRNEPRVQKIHTEPISAEEADGGGGMGVCAEQADGGGGDWRMRAKTDRGKRSGRK